MVTVWIHKVAPKEYRVQVRSSSNELLQRSELTHNREGAKQVADYYAEKFDAIVKWGK